jgi:tRNA A-37 threonylcarbamoyl transferase component Bud32
MPATLSGRYRLDALIGDGGMGEVWKAHDPVLDRVVAVKVIRPHLADDLRIRERLRTEAKLAGSLRHPGIVDVFDYGEHIDGDGRATPYLVMPLVDGVTLSDILASRGSLPLGETMSIVAEMASALQTAHAAGIVHRDLKPANVMLTASGRVMILDFGIARSTGGESLTQTGALVGTADYLSPEQAAGHPATYASDLYALGVVAYTCLTGATPFHRDTDVGTALAHIHTPVPSLPPEMAAADPLIRSLLSKEPTHRPSAGDVAAIAATMATHVPAANGVVRSAEHTRTDLQPVGAADTTTISEVAAKPRRRRRKVLIVAGAMLAIVAVVSGLMYAGRPTKITVPDVTSMTSVQAATKLGRADLTVETTEANLPGHKAGDVVKQSIAPGTKVGKDTVIKLTVATGMFQIPQDLVGKSYDDAAAILEGLGLKPNRAQEFSTEEDDDTVLSVNPSSLAKAGDTITLTVAYSFFDFNGNDNSDDKKRRRDG